MEYDLLFLSQIQFALIVSFQIFSTFTIGLDFFPRSKRMRGIMVGRWSARWRGSAATAG